MAILRAVIVDDILARRECEVALRAGKLARLSAARAGQSDRRHIPRLPIVATQDGWPGEGLSDLGQSTAPPRAFGGLGKKASVKCFHFPDARGRLESRDESAILPGGVATPRPAVGRVPPVAVSRTQTEC